MLNPKLNWMHDPNTGMARLTVECSASAGKRYANTIFLTMEEYEDAGLRRHKESAAIEELAIAVGNDVFRQLRRE